jgi:hypothetical protein
MIAVNVATNPGLTGKRLAVALAEDRVAITLSSAVTSCLSSTLTGLLHDQNFYLGRGTLLSLMIAVLTPAARRP